MANRAYLLGSSNAKTAGPTAGINYVSDAEILAEASGKIPVFWLSLFDESDIKQHIMEEHLIPAPVCDALGGRTLLRQRRAHVLTAFTGCEIESEWASWDRL